MIALILLLLAAIAFFGGGLLTLLEGLALKREYGPQAAAEKALAEVAERLLPPPLETLAVHGRVREPAGPKPPPIRPGSYRDHEAFTLTEPEPVVEPVPVPDEERPVEVDEDEHPRAAHSEGHEHTDAWLAFQTGTGHKVRSHRVQRRYSVAAFTRSVARLVRGVVIEIMRRYVQWWQTTTPRPPVAPLAICAAPHPVPRFAAAPLWQSPRLRDWRGPSDWPVITPSPELRHVNPLWRTTPAPVAEPFFTDQHVAQLEPVGASA
jgi:hypothetical protein